MKTTFFVAVSLHWRIGTTNLVLVNHVAMKNIYQTKIASLRGYNEQPGSVSELRLSYGTSGGEDAGAVNSGVPPPAGRFSAMNERVRINMPNPRPHLGFLVRTP